jgi:hypothetical protein
MLLLRRMVGVTTTNSWMLSIDIASHISVVVVPMMRVVRMRRRGLFAGGTSRSTSVVLLGRRHSMQVGKKVCTVVRF